MFLKCYVFLQLWDSSFDIFDDMECQGDDIVNWSDGESANNGAVISGKGLKCASICESHAECIGFTHNKSTNECIWKTSSITTSDSVGKTCYIKKGMTFSKLSVKFSHF